MEILNNNIDGAISNKDKELNKAKEIKKTEEENESYNTGVILNEYQQELMENKIEINTIKEAISNLKSFEDISSPLIINYPPSSKTKIDQKKFPKKLDIRPKPYWNKRKKMNWEIVNTADPLIICLDNRKFKVTPDIGSISKIDINQWNINLDVSKFWVKLTSQVYDPERMTKLLIILRTNKNWLNKDIEWTPWAIVEEIE